MTDHRCVRYRTKPSGDTVYAVITTNRMSIFSLSLTWPLALKVAKPGFSEV